MKLSPREKAAHRAAFREMSPAQKLDHIWTYYKAPILLGLAVLMILASAAKRQLTKKEPAVYLALVNVSVGEDLQTFLTEDYLAAEGLDGRQYEVYLYSGLYLSDHADTLNHQYAYASRMKLTGAISARRLDLVLMNREGYDLLSQKGYLLNLSALEDIQASPLLTENEVVLSDNSLEVLLGEAEEERRLTETVPNALAVASLPLFEQAGFNGDLYIGIIGNTPRPDAAGSYLRYLICSAT